MGSHVKLYKAGCLLPRVNQMYSRQRVMPHWMEGDVAEFERCYSKKSLPAF